jgi:hypothetical protein
METHKIVKQLKVDGFILVDSQIELSHEVDSSDLYDIYYLSTKRGYCAVSHTSKWVYVYGLSEPLKNVIKEHRDEILSYRLANLYNDDTKCTAGDVFMWDGGYIEKLLTINKDNYGKA